MKKSKKRKVILSILLILLVPLAPFLFVIAAFLVLFLGMLANEIVTTAGGWLFSPNPAKPSVTYGEFPFEIVYELDGQIMTINDVYVCEYDGIKLDGFHEKSRKWSGYIKSTGDKKVILFKDENVTFYCYVGYPEYYMSDPPPREEYTPHIDCVRNDTKSTWEIDVDRYLAQYKLRLISVTLSEPIQNSFD